MQMRLDSRGSPLRRTFLGNFEQYVKGHQKMLVKNGLSLPHANRKQNHKLATEVINNLIQQQFQRNSNLLQQPNINSKLTMIH